MDFSYHRSSPFSLSPKNLHNVDPISELRKLRRSISRSPSRQLSKTPIIPSSPRSQLPPSQLIPSSSPIESSGPQSSRFQCSTSNEDFSSTKQARSSLPRSTPIKSLFRPARSHSGSPMRRALGNLTDHGNADVACPQSYDGQENQDETDLHLKRRFDVETTPNRYETLDLVPPMQCLVCDMLRNI